jgi:hypothetical protein
MTKTTEAKWRRVIAEQERSGLSAREFAESRGIPAATLYWWRSRLRREVTKLVPVEVVDAYSEDEHGGNAEVCFEVQVDRSVTVRVPRGFSETELRRLLVALRC